MRSFGAGLQLQPKNLQLQPLNMGQLNNLAAHSSISPHFHDQAPARGDSSTLGLGSGFQRQLPSTPLGGPGQSSQLMFGGQNGGVFKQGLSNLHNSQEESNSRLFKRAEKLLYDNAMVKKSA
jgi:hypothetical protein